MSSSRRNFFPNRINKNRSWNVWDCARVSFESVLFTTKSYIHTKFVCTFKRELIRHLLASSFSELFLFPICMHTKIVGRLRCCKTPIITANNAKVKAIKKNSFVCCWFEPFVEFMIFFPQFMCLLFGQFQHKTFWKRTETVCLCARYARQMHKSPNRTVKHKQKTQMLCTERNEWAYIRTSILTCETQCI